MCALLQLLADHVTSPGTYSCKQCMQPQPCVVPCRLLSVVVTELKKALDEVNRKDQASCILSYARLPGTRADIVLEWL